MLKHIHIVIPFFENLAFKLCILNYKLETY